MSVAPLERGDWSRLKRRLDALVLQYDRRFLDSDPLQFVHRYRNPRDQEVAGLVAASLAYGKVSIVIRSVGRVLETLGPSPSWTLRRDDARAIRQRLEGVKHRLNDADDIALVLHLVAQQLRRSGSLESLFLEGYDDEDPSVASALTHFVETIYAGQPEPLDPRIAERPSVRHMLSSPARGSACKRMMMYLRWMVRPADGLDVGIWSQVSPDKLIMPLDTHTFRIGRYLGLVRRRTHDLKAAEEMTAALKQLDPDDPVRYDFALARLGILDLCPRRRDPIRCARCDLVDVCRL